MLDIIGQSDHWPIFTSINPRKKKKFKRRTKWNFKKADWNKYNGLLSQQFKEIMDKEYASVDNIVPNFERGEGVAVCCQALAYPHMPASQCFLSVD